LEHCCCDQKDVLIYVRKVKDAHHSDEFKDQFRSYVGATDPFQGFVFPLCFDIMELYCTKGTEGKRKTTKCNVDVDAVPAHGSQPK
jgi:hypothetical protein